MDKIRSCLLIVFMLGGLAGAGVALMNGYLAFGLSGVLFALMMGIIVFGGHGHELPHIDQFNLVDSLIGTWGGKLMLGLILFTVAAFFHGIFALIDDESVEGVPWLLSMMHDKLGTWGSTALFAVPGALFVLLALVHKMTGDDPTS